MTRSELRIWLLAAGVAMVAGYVDAVGFLKLGGLFVSFMSGNSTRLAVGLASDWPVAAAAAGLIASFVAGVLVGTLVAAATGSWRKPGVLLLVALLLGMAAATGADVTHFGTTPLMAAAMGAANTLFQRDGEVRIGLTYMTGTLVKFGQHLATTLMGGAPFGWLPYLALWCSLIGGATMGVNAYHRIGVAGSLWWAVGVVVALALFAALLGPAERIRPRGGGLGDGNA